MGADRVQVHICGGDGEVSFGLHWSGVVALLEELARGLVALVADLSISLRTAFHEDSERAPVEWSEEQMNVVWHETQPVNQDVRVGQMSVQQSHEIEIVASVREEPSTIVAAQDDVVGHSFQDLAVRSRHGAALSAAAHDGFPNDLSLRFSA
jgi:hypothetical protein